MMTTNYAISLFRDYFLCIQLDRTRWLSWWLAVIWLTKIHVMCSCSWNVLVCVFVRSWYEMKKERKKFDSNWIDCKSFITINIQLILDNGPKHLKLFEVRYKHVYLFIYECTQSNRIYRATLIIERQIESGKSESMSSRINRFQVHGFYTYIYTCSQAVKI